MCNFGCARLWGDLCAGGEQGQPAWYVRRWRLVIAIAIAPQLHHQHEAKLDRSCQKKPEKSLR